MRELFLLVGGGVVCFVSIVLLYEWVFNGR